MDDLKIVDIFMKILLDWYSDIKSDIGQLNDATSILVLKAKCQNNRLQQNFIYSKFMLDIKNNQIYFNNLLDMLLYKINSWINEDYDASADKKKVVKYFFTIFSFTNINLKDIRDSMIRHLYYKNFSNIANIAEIFAE